MFGMRTAYCNDEFAATANPRERRFYILNLQNSNERGSHWVSLYNSGTHIDYSDPFGAPPTYEVQRWIEHTNLPASYNTVDLQAYTSQSCGWFGLYIGLELRKGRTFDEVISDFTTTPASNELMLQQYFA